MVLQRNFFIFTDNLGMAFRKKRANGGLFNIKTSEQLKSSLQNNSKFQGIPLFLNLSTPITMIKKKKIKKKKKAQLSQQSE